MNEAAEEGRAKFDVEQIVDQLIERILDKRPLPLESDCLLDICIQENIMCFLNIVLFKTQNSLTLLQLA